MSKTPRRASGWERGSSAVDFMVTVQVLSSTYILLSHNVLLMQHSFALIGLLILSLHSAAYSFSFLLIDWFSSCIFSDRHLAKLIIKSSI